MNQKTYFVSNKSTQTIGGVQTIMRLIEEAHPNHSFVELPIMDSKNDLDHSLLDNVEVVQLLSKINDYVDITIENLFKKEEKELIAGGSKIVVFGVQKLFLVPEDFLKKNEVIIFQSTRPDLTFGLPKLSEVPKILENKVKHINKFVTFTKHDREIIKEIIDESDISPNIQWFTIPNPSKTKREKLSQYTKNLMYLGRFDFFQKNMLEYVKVNERLPEKYQLNMYGYGAAESMLKAFDLNLAGKINDISDVAAENSVLLLLSTSEGFGNVLVEAMSVGMPIVVYDSYPAAKSIVTDGVGKLVPYGKTDLVVAAVEEILKDEETFEQYSSRAFEASKRYEKEEIIREYKKVLDL